MPTRDRLAGKTKQGATSIFIYFLITKAMFTNSATSSQALVLLEFREMAINPHPQEPRGKILSLVSRYQKKYPWARSLFKTSNDYTSC
jgi:hypothetical protein